MAVFMTVITVGVLHVAASAAPSDDSGMIRALYLDAPASLEPMVDIHATLGVVNIGLGSVGTGPDRTAIGGMGGFASVRCASGGLGSTRGCTWATTRTSAATARSGGAGLGPCSTPGSSGSTCCTACSSGPGRTCSAGPCRARSTGPGRACSTGLRGSSWFCRGFGGGFGRRFRSAPFFGGSALTMQAPNRSTPNIPVTYRMEAFMV